MNDDKLITLTGSLGCLSNSLGRLFWNNCFDYISFKKIITILNVSLLFICVSCLFIENKYLFVVIVNLSYFFGGSYYGLMPTQTVRVIGEKHGTTFYSFIFSFFALASIVQFIVHEFVIMKWGNDGFRYVFIGFCVIQIISIVLILMFKF